MIRRLLAATDLLDPARDVARAGRVAARRLRHNLGRGFGRLDRRLVADYLREHSPRKLHLGAGPHELAGWLNTDRHPQSRHTLQLDVTRRFPFDDDTFDYIATSHMIEHLPHTAGVTMLRECWRVLVPGGTVRVSTPDFAFLLALYANPSDPLHAGYIEWSREWINRGDPDCAPTRDPIFVVNNFVRDWGHEFIYDRASLHGALAGAGFEALVDCALNQSEDACLRNLENEQREPPGFLRLETMTVEGRKPVAARRT